MCSLKNYNSRWVYAFGPELKANFEKVENSTIEASRRNIFGMQSAVGEGSFTNSINDSGALLIKDDVTWVMEAKNSEVVIRRKSNSSSTQNETRAADKEKIDNIKNKLGWMNNMILSPSLCERNDQSQPCWAQNSQVDYINSHNNYICDRTSWKSKGLRPWAS